VSANATGGTNSTAFAHVECANRGSRSEHRGMAKVILAGGPSFALFNPLLYVALRVWDDIITIKEKRCKDMADIFHAYGMLWRGWSRVDLMKP
jgi:hypothetical protein